MHIVFLDSSAHGVSGSSLKDWEDVSHVGFSLCLVKLPLAMEPTSSLGEMG